MYFDYTNYLTRGNDQYGCRMRNCDHERASIFARLLGEMRYLVYEISMNSVLSWPLPANVSFHSAREQRWSCVSGLQISISVCLVEECHNFEFR